MELSHKVSMRKYFDLKETPFSRKDSYFAINQRANELLVRDLHGGDEAPSDLLKITLPCESDVILEPSVLTIKDNDGYTKFAIDRSDVLHIKTTNMKLNVVAMGSRYDTFVKLDDKSFEYSVYPQRAKFGFSVTQGKLNVLSTWDGLKSGKVEFCIESNTEIMIHRYKTVFKTPNDISIDKVIDDVSAEYLDYYNDMIDLVNPKYKEKYKETIDESIYILWTNFVGACGKLSKPAIYCSKNYMNNAWSWDYLFMTLALAKARPKWAYDQIELFIEAQDESGCLPDYINDDFYSYSCVKPPVQGILIPLIYNEHEYFNDKFRLNNTYVHLKRLFKFWMEYRTRNSHLPFYFHGNDSGWDNATVFICEPPIISPDLSSYLIVLAKCIKDLANKLEKLTGANLEKEKDYFDNIQNVILDELLKECSDGKRFYSKRYETKEIVTQGDSLINYIPLILADRLDDELVENMVEDLSERFIGEWGIATESPMSPFYEDDGYWRGPIWPPTTLIMYEALLKAGKLELAEEIKIKYCDLVAQGGFGENYNIFTGASNKDQGFGWAAGVFFHFMKK